ncbi:response regulator transcription factor [bacterium]|nr:response regulator transcription factor [bacterium]
MKTILIVEDREDIAELIQVHLEKDGFATLLASNGEKAIEILGKLKVDLILLDLMLPRISGMEVLKIIKSHPKWGSIPVIIESARSDETDIVEGLELGADDYVTKPFSQKVLLARIHKILDRLSFNEKVFININQGELMINRESMEVVANGTLLLLTSIEYKLLELLALNEDKVLNRDFILEAIWKDDAIVVDRVIDVHITLLRKKLGESSRFIHTIRGVGYRFSSRMVKS